MLSETWQAAGGLARLVGFVLTPMAAMWLAVLVVVSAVVSWWLVRSGRVAGPVWLLFAANRLARADRGGDRAAGTVVSRLAAESLVG